MTTFFIAPFTPTNWKSISSDLAIDLTSYKQQLIADWPYLKFYDPSPYILLAWGVAPSNEQPDIYCSLLKDQQTLTLATPYEPFFLWHRRVIPAEYRLYLFHESSLDSMELKPETKLVDLRRYLGES